MKTNAEQFNLSLCPCLCRYATLTLTALKTVFITVC